MSTQQVSSSPEKKKVVRGAKKASVSEKPNPRNESYSAFPSTPPPRRRRRERNC